MLPSFRLAATSHLLIIRPSGEDLVTTIGSNSGDIVGVRSRRGVKRGLGGVLVGGLERVRGRANTNLGRHPLHRKICLQRGSVYFPPELD